MEVLLSFFHNNLLVSMSWHSFHRLDLERLRQVRRESELEQMSDHIYGCRNRNSVLVLGSFFPSSSRKSADHGASSITPPVSKKKFFRKIYQGRNDFAPFSRPRIFHVPGRYAYAILKFLVYNRTYMGAYMPDYLHVTYEDAA